MSAAPLLDVALFPLQTVLFPEGLLPLRLFEQRYLEMAKTCLREDRPFGVCRIREGPEVGAPATPEDVGCLARIAHWDMQQLGVLNIVAQGTQRFRILEREDAVQRMIADLRGLLERWLPDILRENRSTLTIAIGCTGGRHRSVYVAERLAEALRAQAQVLVRHRGLARDAADE